MDRLLREGNPPAGQLASPKPQYKKPGVDEYAPVEGQHGAPFATLKDASGNVVSPATEAKLEQVRALLSGVATENKLEQARVLLNTISTKDFATQTTLAAVLAKLGQLETEIQAVKANQLSGDQKVQLSGTNVTIDEAWIQDVTVTAGSTALVGQTGNLSCRRITFAVAERAQAAHKFQVGYRPKVSGSNMSLIDGPRMGNESTFYATYVHFNVEAPRYYVYIKNNDTVDHTYNVYKYEFAN